MTSMRFFYYGQVDDQHLAFSWFTNIPLATFATKTEAMEWIEKANHDATSS